MLKKTISYTDYDGNQRKEDFYFNLTRAELMMLNLSEVGGLQRKLNTIIQTQDVPTIMETFREIILKSYGQPSPDGRRFIKSEELSKEFEQTEAFSELFMELCYDSDAASRFLTAVIPTSLAKEVEKYKDADGVIHLPDEANT